MNEIMIERQSIWPLIILFLGYIAIQTWLSLQHKKYEKAYNIHREDQDLERLTKLYKTIETVFPFAYVILILIIFYS